MSEVGKQMIEAAKEALDVAKGKEPAASVTINGHTYYPQAFGPFKRGDYVRKKSGAWWEGFVVGGYSTEQTPDGVCVQLDKPMGPVQIYPASALELVAKDSAADVITTLTAELSALRATAEKLDKMDGMDGAACAVIRQKLDDFGAPHAAFIDDHVANGIVHAKRLARAEALEEAAKVADQHAAAIRADEAERESWNGPDPRAPIPSRYAAAGEAIALNKAAASIRALMVKP